jgi:hypothetical protein
MYRRRQCIGDAEEDGETEYNEITYFEGIIRKSMIRFPRLVEHAFDMCSCFSNGRALLCNKKSEDVVRVLIVYFTFTTYNFDVVEVPHTLICGEGASKPLFGKSERFITTDRNRRYCRVSCVIGEKNIPVLGCRIRMARLCRRQHWFEHNCMREAERSDCLEWEGVSGQSCCWGGVVTERKAERVKTALSSMCLSRVRPTIQWTG